MVEHHNSVSAVAAQLVAAGWHRQDPGADGLYRTRDTNWWCCSTEQGLIEDDGPRTLLSFHRRGDSWSCTVAADQESGQIEDVTIWTERSPGPPDCLLTCGWWPGLTPLVAMADQLMAALLADG